MTNEELAQHLAVIRRSSGSLTPAAVVGAAAHPTHPLHHRFEWDDTEAANKYRLEQARSLIRSVQIIVEKETARGVKQVRVRGIANVVKDEVRQYVPVSEVKTDADLSQQVLESIRRDLGVVKRKYAAYSELFAQALAEAASEQDKNGTLV
jgi:Arc/MetJ family transcription regulator